MKRIIPMVLLLVLLAGGVFVGLNSFADDNVSLSETSTDQLSLNEELESVRRERDNCGKGYIVIGKVVLDGEGSLYDIVTQMPILQDGSFVDVFDSLDRPILFRLHQYEPVDVSLEGKTGDPIDLGEIHLKPLPPEKLCKLKGKVETEDANPNVQVQVSLRIQQVRYNTNHISQIRSALSDPPAPIPVTVGQDGLISAHGFSPIKYCATISAPGYVKQCCHCIEFQEGKESDLGTIVLEKAHKIKLTYIVSDEPSFDINHKEETIMTLDEPVCWEPTPEGHISNIYLHQKHKKINMSAHGTLIFFYDLGEKELTDIIKSDALSKNNSDDLSTKEMRLQNKHVYLLKRKNWQLPPSLSIKTEYWEDYILFKLEIIE